MCIKPVDGRNNKMTSFTESTLRHGLFENAYDLLTALCSTSATVTASYTDDVHNLPEVVIEPFTIDMDSFMLDRTHPTKTIPLTVSLYTQKAETLDKLADLITTNLTTSLTTGTTKWKGMVLDRFTEDTAHTTPKESKLHSKTFIWTFRRKK